MNDLELEKLQMELQIKIMDLLKETIEKEGISLLQSVFVTFFCLSSVISNISCNLHQNKEDSLNYVDYLSENSKKLLNNFYK